jgi:hypothetical protein
MGKAILELPEMPENCVLCTLSTYKDYSKEVYVSKQNIGKGRGWYCTAFANRVLCPDVGRHPSCPLKPAEEGEEIR